MYKVEEFRRFLKGRGSTGQGLVQFQGARATRRYKVGKGVRKPSWTVDAEQKMHTVDLGQISVK